MNTYQDSDLPGAEWTVKPKVADISKNSQAYVATPFTKIKSPSLRGETFPIIDHDVGAGNPARQRQKLMDTYAGFLKAHLDVKGESSPYVQDWKQLNQATQNLIQGVIDGDIDAVKQSIKQGADPNMLVNVRDPNVQGDQNKYVLMPVGVAAVIWGQEKAKAEGSRAAAAPFQEIAQSLIMAGGQPSIELGASPNQTPNGTNGFAISYNQPGFCISGPDAGSESIETRCVDIPIDLYNAIGRAAPQAFVDKTVSPSTDGVLVGEEFPNSVPEPIKIIGTADEAVRSAIERFRDRRGGEIGGGGKSPSFPGKKF